MESGSYAVPLWIAGVCVGLMVSCAIATAAGRRSQGAWAWGLLGPVGWIIAAIHSIETAVSADRPPPVLEWFPCGACDAHLCGFRCAGATIACGRCGATKHDFSSAPPR